MKFNVLSFPSNMFLFIKETNTFVAEASELGNRHLQQLYSDCGSQLGFKIRSIMTGVEITFFLIGVNKDREGEIQSWEYIAAADSVKKCPAAGDWTVKVYND